MIAFHFLFDKQDLQVLRHAFELTTCESVHEAGLTNTVSTDQTVLSAVGQAELGIFEECSTADDDVDVVQLEILCFRFLVSVVAHLLYFYDSQYTNGSYFCFLLEREAVLSLSR